MICANPVDTRLNKAAWIVTVMTVVSSIAAKPRCVQNQHYLSSWFCSFSPVGTRRLFRSNTRLLVPNADEDRDVETPVCLAENVILESQSQLIKAEAFSARHIDELFLRGEAVLLRWNMSLWRYGAYLAHPTYTIHSRLYCLHAGLTDSRAGPAAPAFPY